MRHHRAGRRLVRSFGRVRPAPAAGGPIALTDFRGKQVTLPAPATRVVGLEWNVVEHAVSLGVMPVGAADIAGYTKWVKAEPLEPSVKDVGVRGEPSIDSIAALRPDLILATDELPEAAVTQMEKFAPVVFVPGGDAKDPVGQMRRNLTLVGKALGKDAEATALLAAFDAKVADGKTKLAAEAGQPFMFADAYVEGSQVSIRPFSKGSLLSGVDRAARARATRGRTRATRRTASPRPTSRASPRVGDVDFIYIANDGDGGDPFGNQLAANAVWKSLPFVTGGKVHRLPDGIWMFGGPTSMETYVDAVVTALTR